MFLKTVKKKEDRFHKYSTKTRDFFKEIFGEDATTKSDKSSLGNVLDQTWIDVLKDSGDLRSLLRYQPLKTPIAHLFPSLRKQKIFCVCQV